jgi:hypothetical protein
MIARIHVASSTTSTDMKEMSDTCAHDGPLQAVMPGTPAEIEVLLCCARTSIDSETLDRLRTLLRQNLDWRGLIRTASIHGMLPLLYRNLYNSFQDRVPKAILDELRESFRSNVQHSLLLTGELLKLLDLFAVHGIDAIPFKGPVLAAAVYKDLSLRQFSDLDVLVSRDDIPRTGDLLGSQGYRSVTENGVSSEQNFDPEDVAYFGPKFYTFVHQDRGTRVDLQWRVTERYFSFSLDDNQGRGRLVPVTLAGRSVLTFAPMDKLLILCAHGAKHQWQELKWICDVAELVRTEKEKIDWRKLQQEASQQGVGRMLGLGLYLARDLLGAELPVEVSKAIDKDLRGGWVVARILSKLFTEPLQSWGGLEKVVFYLRTMDRWQDRVRFCSSFLSQCLRTVATPTSKEREFLSLPPPLSFLYYVFRPLRLTVKYLELALRRVFREKRPGAGSDSTGSSHV